MVGTGRTLVRTTSASAEVVRYVIDLRSMPRGKGSFARRFLPYEELPPHLAAKGRHSRRPTPASEPATAR